MVKYKLIFSKNFKSTPKNITDFIHTEVHNMSGVPHCSGLNQGSENRRIAQNELVLL